jgi:CubicO group peptidase (beta-lactamase class C family)
MNIREQIDPGFRGVIHVLRHGEVLCSHVSGLADLPNQIPNTFETRFASASAGKAFVAAGILRLIDRGLLTLDSTLGSLLDFDLGAIDRDVTVYQLLTHTAGVPDYFDETVMGEYEELWVDFPNYKIRKNSDLYPLFLHKPMLYPKGEKFQYNNSGYVLLAAIIEAVTGMAFDQYLQEEVFDLCGMTDTGYFELDRLPARCAANYIIDKQTGAWRTNIFSVDAKGTGAGGAFLTVPDVVKFWHGLLGGKLFSMELVEQMLRIQAGDGADPEEGWYGLGMWIIPNAGGTDYPYFQGCDPGVSFHSEYNPDKGILSVLVSNYRDNVWREMRKLRKLLY